MNFKNIEKIIKFKLLPALIKTSEDFKMTQIFTIKEKRLKYHVLIGICVKACITGTLIQYLDEFSSDTV